MLKILITLGLFAMAAWAPGSALAQGRCEARCERTMGGHPGRETACKAQCCRVRCEQTMGGHPGRETACKSNC